MAEYPLPTHPEEGAGEGSYDDLLRSTLLAYREALVEQVFNVRPIGMTVEEWEAAKVRAQQRQLHRAIEWAALTEREQELALRIAELEASVRAMQDRMDHAADVLSGGFCAHDDW